MHESGRTPSPERLCAQAIIDAYAVGSGDWTWDDERLDITATNREYFESLRWAIEHEGVLEPVLLGDDGRVWDGHHRILAAHSIDPLMDLPVEYGTGGNAVTAPARVPTDKGRYPSTEGDT